MSNSMQNLTRREFIRGSAAVAGAAMFAPLGSALAQNAAVKRTATDIVTLNKTGIKLSRVGIGTGANNGAENMAAGAEAFIKTIRHAYDQGIVYIDCAQRYATFPIVKDAIKGKPYKVNLYSDDGTHFTRVKLDLDRDDKWDESWTFDADGGIERKVAPADDENYSETWLLDHGAWKKK